MNKKIIEQLRISGLSISDSVELYMILKSIGEDVV